MFKKIFFKNSRSKDESFFKKINKLIGFQIKNPEIYKEAFTHKSSQQNHKNGKAYNFERLEFLGDSILGNVVTIYLYHSAPDKDEGYLTQMRSKFVSRNHLNAIGKSLNISSYLISLDPHLQLGKNIDGNLLEALIGAIYIDRGYDYAEAFIYKHIIKKYKSLSILEKTITSYKGLLFEYVQGNKIQMDLVTVELAEAKKDDQFVTELKINNKLFAKGKAKSKRQSEEIASEIAYKILIKNNK